MRNPCNRILVYREAFRLAEPLGLGAVCDRMTYIVCVLVSGL